jgi:hypothetical protein
MILDPRLRRVIAGFLAGLAVYSVVLASIEVTTSYDNARHYFTDITGPVPFYAINTSVSVFLLAGTALLFGVAWFCVDREHEAARLRTFYASQVIVFLYLAADDRFRLHEWIGFTVGIPDALILLGVGVVELVLLGRFSGLLRPSSPVRPWLIAAGALFVFMLAIDFLLPRRLVLRLAVEDLSKVWGEACLFMAAFILVHRHIEMFKRREVGKTDWDNLVPVSEPPRGELAAREGG